MALLTSEITRIRAELGYNTLDAGAEPYIGVTAIFDQVIARYLRAGATTTSSTTVAASSAYAPATLTLASATGFSAGDSIVVDVDSRQEIVTCQSVSGATMTALLRLAHAGTYPVTVEGGETIVRQLLGQLRAVTAEFDAGGSAIGASGVKRVDEIEFQDGGGKVAGLFALRDRLRDELASSLGVTNVWRMRQASGSSMVLW